MAELLTMGEKGQIVIPKKMRENFKLEKGAKLLAVEEGDKIIVKPVTLDEDHFWMLASELSLKKTWDNPRDERWDDVL